MEERRKHKRIRVHNSVDVKLYSAHGVHLRADDLPLCRATDYSATGLRLEADQPLPMGAKLKMRVSLTDPPSTFIQSAAVRWSEGTPNRCAMGIEFIESATGTNLEEWGRLVEHRLLHPVELV